LIRYAKNRVEYGWILSSGPIGQTLTQLKKNINPIEKEKKNYSLWELNFVPSTLKIALNTIYYASYVVIKFIL